MMDKNQALAKIKKCLALSHSTNEYEAAQAFKHAHVLMQQYNLGTTDIELADVGEQNIRTTKTLPQWHWDLSLVCARAFDCRRWKQDRDTGSFFIFCGLNGKQELAAYAYEVLLRQIKSARRSYIKETLNGSQPTKKKKPFCRNILPGIMGNFGMPKSEPSKVRCYLVTTFAGKRPGPMLD